MGQRGRALKEDQALAAGVAETVVQLVAAANHGIKVDTLEVSWNSIDNTEVPVLVEVIRENDAGTSAALTPVKLEDSNADALDTTARKDFTVEPAVGDILWAMRIHPQAGGAFPLDGIKVGAGDRVGVRMNSAQVLNATVGLSFTE